MTWKIDENLSNIFEVRGGTARFSSSSWPRTEDSFSNEIETYSFCTFFFKATETSHIRE